MILVFLVSLILVFLLFRNSYQQDNKKIVDILAVIFSFTIFLTYLLFLNWFVAFFYILTVSKFFIIIIALFALAFILGGIISKIYFSKYYGRIIILIGVVLHILLALFKINLTFREIYLSGMFMEWLFVNLWNIAVIIFWCRYWLLQGKIKFSLASKKKDPKDW